MTQNQGSTSIDPQGLYEVMRRPNRVYEGHPDHWLRLREIAQVLREEATSRALLEEKILLGGWHLDEEKHGGYQMQSGKRDFLGKGVLLFQARVPGSETSEDRHLSGGGRVRKKREVWLQVWQQDKRTIFLALGRTMEEGYVGIDNHHGTDTTWEVIVFRAFPSIKEAAT